MEPQSLVADHVLCNQSTVVEELIYCEKLQCESLYDVNCEVLEWWARARAEREAVTTPKRPQETITAAIGGGEPSGQPIFQDGVITQICC